MLHVPLRGRQVASCLSALCLAAVVTALPQHRAHAERPADTTQAEIHARGGQHAEAARLYEQAARRGFLSWDARLALLAARERVRAFPHAGRWLDIGRQEDYETANEEAAP